ncbi:MAG: ABC transporter ATP-binding protein [Desulfomicrobium escambiense]|nr:ABC transporter ATP-binding protein [Desulfomicrobium escambiense]
MRILTGYLPADVGPGDRRPASTSSTSPTRSSGRSAICPRSSPLYPDMTVSAYLGFVAEIKQVPKAKRKAAVDRVLAVGRPAATSPSRLIRNISRGYKQRVGIAQAMIHDPQVLILDEPTIGLDPAQIREIRELIRGPQGEHTILLSTHILPEVTQVCDGVVIINQGRLAASGSLEDLAASFEKRDGVMLRLRRAGAEEAELLRGLPGVERVTVEGTELRVEWARGRDLRDDVARLVLGKGLGLREMRSVGGIEDLYMKIVSGRARTMTNIWSLDEKGAALLLQLARRLRRSLRLRPHLRLLLLQPGHVVQPPGHADGPEPLLRPADQRQRDGLLAPVPQHGPHPHPAHAAADHAPAGRGEEERAPTSSSTPRR